MLPIITYIERKLVVLFCRHDLFQNPVLAAIFTHDLLGYGLLGVLLGVLLEVILHPIGSWVLIGLVCGFSYQVLKEADLRFRRFTRNQVYGLSPHDKFYLRMGRWDHFFYALAERTQDTTQVSFRILKIYFQGSSSEYKVEQVLPYCGNEHEMLHLRPFGKYRGSKPHPVFTSGSSLEGTLPGGRHGYGCQCWSCLSQLDDR